MRIHELIFQGVLGVDRPGRLRPDGALTRLVLPAPMTLADLQALLITCLYPTYLTEEMSQRLGFGESTKLAVILDSKQGTLRVIRRQENGSVRLQQKGEGGYKDLAVGAAAVQSFLVEKFRMPRIEVFLPLHLWQFDPEQLPERPEGAQFGDDPRIPELIELYLTSLEVESVEDRIKELEIRIREGKEALGQGVELEEKLSRAREKLAEIRVQELTEEEMELISNQDEKLEEFRDQLFRLRSEEATEADLVRSLIPESPARTPVFWFGLVVAIVMMGASVYQHDSHRLLALFAIPGLGVAAFQLLQYFDKMGRASVHQVRLNSIQRRIDQVLQADILYRDQIEHLILHVGVRDEEELRERMPMAAKLSRIIEKLEERLEKVRLNPEYRAARKELTAMQNELQALRSARAQLPEYVMNSYQLENDLKTLGVDPLAVREHEEVAGAEEEVSAESLGATPFAWLLAVARWTDQWQGDRLDETASAMWAKVCGHVLSERFAEVDLSPEGELIVGSLTDEQRELWQRTRSSEVFVIQAALALALHINAQRRGGAEQLSSVWINDPGQAMTPGHASKFESIFKSAAKNSQILILGEAQ